MEAPGEKCVKGVAMKIFDKRESSFTEKKELTRLLSQETSFVVEYS